MYYDPNDKCFAKLNEFYCDEQLYYLLPYIYIYFVGYVILLLQMFISHSFSDYLSLLFYALYCIQKIFFQIDI